MKLIRIIAVSAAAYFSTQASSVAGSVPPEARGMQAVARVFVLTYDLHHPNITLNDSSDPPWSEALLNGGPTIDLLIKKRAGTPCTYDIGRAIIGHDSGGDTVDMEAPIKAIAFDRLSAEIETSWISHYHYYKLTVFGLPNAVCDFERGKQRCFDQLHASLWQEDDVRSLMRVLRFVFEHVCAPAKLPF